MTKDKTPQVPVRVPKGMPVLRPMTEEEFALKRAIGSGKFDPTKPVKTKRKGFDK
jgi:hypothetical protein